MKKIVSLLSIFTLFLSLLTGCGTDETSEADTYDTQTHVTDISTDTQTNASDINTEPDISYTESPVENFEYKINDDGGITITKYIGTELNVVVPANINDKKVTCIGIHSFSSSNIHSIKMPDSITKIEHNAFLGCKSLTSVILSKNLSIIEHEAFFECSSLCEITLPSSLTLIENWAFGKCESLKHINIPQNALSEYSWSAFNSSGLETVFLEDQTIIPYGVFAYTKLTEIAIPNSVKKIDNFAFMFCSELSSVQLNNGLESMGNQVFDSTKLSIITIPSSVKNVTENTFLGCSTLKKLFFEGNAPNNYKSDINYPSNYTIYFHSEAEGFSSPNWNGFKTEIW